MLFESHPALIFTVTVLVETFLILLIISPASPGVFISALPSPFFTILGVGHPIFTSIISISFLSLI